MFKAIIKRFIKNNAPRWLVLIIDIYIVVNAFILSYLIRFNFNFDFDSKDLILQLVVTTFISLLSFLAIGSYKGIIRHTGYRDSLNIVVASFLILLMLSSIVFLNKQFNIIVHFTIPISILIIHFLLNVFVLIVSRYLFKMLYVFLITDFKVDTRVLIYGAGETGLLTYSVLRDLKENKVLILGFIDDNKRKSGKKINGLVVYDSSVIDADFIKSKKIDEIIVSIQKVNPSKLIEIVDRLADLNVKVKIVPPAATWIEGDLKPQQIKQAKIEDLLGREPIELNNPILRKEFINQVVFITGAAGSIGSEISRQITTFKAKQIIILDQSESELYNLQQSFINKGILNTKAVVADVRNRKRMEMLFQKYQPTMIFHAAAYKHVPFMEEYPYEAVAVNVAGTRNIADLAVKYNVEKFVMISTDKAVNPTNVMGASKRIAEMYITTLHNIGVTKFITTRFGNVLGSNGSVIPLFQAQIEEGGPLTVTDKNITRYFMTIPEACQLVLEAGAMGKGGEIYVFDMGESIKIYDLARNMIQLSGLRFPQDIDIKITGLRPGEKIYEELLADGENTSPTYHEKIMIASVKEIDRLEVNKAIEVLCSLNKDINYKDIVGKMKEIVPEFISNNSKYAELDVKSFVEEKAS